MATIKINLDGRDYTLTYTRRTVTQMSDNGFNIQKAIDDPVSGIPKLFAGAFLKYHRTISQNEIDKIWDAIPSKEEFITKLVEMYNEPVDALFGEPEDEEKKAMWEVVK